MFDKATLQDALFFRTPTLILATTPILALWVYLFWGVFDIRGWLWFAIGTLGTAIAWSTQGWEPWNMALNQVLRGRAIQQSGRTPTQSATAEFFATPRMKRLQFTYVGAGALLPLLIETAGQTLDAHPLHAWTQPMQWWVLIILGVVEAARGRALALYVLAGALQTAWPQLSGQIPPESSHSRSGSDA